jgi:hypothetical protein
MMNRLSKIITCGLVLGLGVSLTGCETTGESAGLGAVFGATAGAIIGNQSGNSEQGALIGAVIGGFSGAIVHDVQKSKVERRMTAEETVIEYDYQPTQGESLVFEDSSIEPESIVRGSMATAGMQYAILGTGAGKQVTETRVIKRNGEIISKISSQKYTRNDGTWVSTQQFRIPENWEAGKYTLEQSADTIKSSVMGTTNFYVE